MSIYDSLNPEQLKAVQHGEGPLLILAGAGSGKTRVLTHRIAYLIEECGVNPFNILAITFTNKAAGEMRERVDNLIGFGGESVWVATFHSTCVRILRRYIDRIGYDKGFTIYDSDDQKTLVREVCKYLNIDTKTYKEKTFINVISSCKDECITPEGYEASNPANPNTIRNARVYREYQRRLKAANALDFDDLIMKTIELFDADKEVLENYRQRFKYIMVDEYQDTNTAQFKLVSKLATYTTEDGEVQHNLCVVGDDDQSIYKFRGANIKNILNFEDTYPDTKVIKLEENYRSNGNILDAANEIVKNNIARKSKALWTKKDKGEPIHYTTYYNEYEEAEGIAGEIERLSADRPYRDFAVLYRTNAQSRVLEEKLVMNSIPYKVYGGVNFYQRKEIKDVLAYLKVLLNPSDDIAIKRIINVPKRGIGLTTIDKVEAYAAEQGISFFDALLQVPFIPELKRAGDKLTSFANFIRSESAHLLSASISEVTKEILEETGYLEMLKEDEDDETLSRVDNVDELLNKIIAYEEDEGPEPRTLAGFLEEVSLVADIDSLDNNEEGDAHNHVTLMTLHSAKGLEFPVVFIPGMEDGLFPGYMSITSDDPSDIEEERRLCYVGVTRAMEKLYLSNARTRMSRGEQMYNKPSRFINEIPRYLLQTTASEKPDVYEQSKRIRSGYGDSYGKNFDTESSLFSSSSSRISSAKQSKGKSDLFSNPYIMKGMGGLKDGSNPDYGVGDKVSHIKFGVGVVKEMNPKDGDTEVVIEFEGENVGVRKLRASFAKLKKL